MRRFSRASEVLLVENEEIYYRVSRTIYWGSPHETEYKARGG